MQNSSSSALSLAENEVTIKSEILESARTLSCWRLILNVGNNHLEKKEMNLRIAPGQELRTVLRKDLTTWKGVNKFRGGARKFLGTML